MGRRITDGSYEDWLNHVFDHPVTDPAWHWADGAEEWATAPTTTAKCLTRLFQEAGRLPERFSDEQIQIGLNFLVSPSCSNHFFVLLDPAVSWELKKAGLAAIQHVFADLFAPRCSDHLGHLGEPEANALNPVCYMWWDIAPILGEPDTAAFAERDALILKVMADTLGLNSEACRESALHGLGHWHSYYPDEVQTIIYDFIWKDRKIRDSLRNYAYAAMHGDVL